MFRVIPLNDFVWYWYVKHLQWLLHVQSGLVQEAIECCRLASTSTGIINLTCTLIQLLMYRYTGQPMPVHT